MSTSTETMIEADFKETALAVPESGRSLAITAQDPDEFIRRAVKQADALKDIIDKRGLKVRIGGPNGKDHVLVDGWECLMALNGVMPFTVSLTREMDLDGELTAHVVTELRRIADGLVLTRVEAECSQSEQRWEKAADFAVISMAQTRGVGKACRQLFGWVMALAGYSSTPAEEMDHKRRVTLGPVAPQTLSARSHDSEAEPPKGTGLSGVMLKMLEEGFDVAGDRNAAKRAVARRVRELGYSDWLDFASRGESDYPKVLETLQAHDRSRRAPA